MYDPPDPAQIATLLQRTPLFALVEREILERLAAAAPLVHAPAGTILIKQGEVGCDAFLLIAGAVDIVVEFVASWPVESVAVSDVPCLSFAASPAAAGWKLVARLRVLGRRVPLSRRVLPAAVSPAPVLADGPADWRVEEPFAGRAALVAGVAAASASLVADLHDVAGDRWRTGGTRCIRSPPVASRRESQRVDGNEAHRASGTTKAAVVVLGHRGEKRRRVRGRDGGRRRGCRSGDRNRYITIGRKSY